MHIKDEFHSLTVTGALLILYVETWTPQQTYSIWLFDQHIKFGNLVIFYWLCFYSACYFMPEGLITYLGLAVAQKSTCVNSKQWWSH